MGIIKFIHSLGSYSDDVFDFKRDYKEALKKPLFKGKQPEVEATLIGTAGSKKDVFVRNDAKHIFICGTTGSGKTIALSNFLKSGMEYDYPMLIIDGKELSNNKMTFFRW